jgi:hypothetical protein
LVLWTSGVGTLIVEVRKSMIMGAPKARIDRLLRTYRRRMEALYGRAFIFTDHTLRRTGGRILWSAGAPIETICDLIWHVDTSETIRYLGIKLDDKWKAMRKASLHKQSLMKP